MKVVEEFPHPVREIENCWIPLSDGCRLAARVWLPGGAETAPVPAIVEYIPYRKRDHTRWRDEPMHRYFAGHGYATLRIDLRGSGDSDGVLLDEYLPREQEDAVEAIAWIARQPWCDGRVGMIGKSWGGFNSLQVAARQPPALGAVISVCAADDRYADDAHYMGGCLLSENLIWGSVLLTLSALPPDPEVVGEGWRKTWLERLESIALYPRIWLAHQRRDGYWKQGSVCEDFSRIRCPVYAVGGWADGYTNGVPRLLAGLRGPRKGLVGPWAHVYPHEGVPGPAIGFLQEALRWWDHWLKGVDTGVMDEPAYRVWMQEGAPPRSFYRERPGRWVAESAWPSERIARERYYLNVGTLDARAGSERALAIASPQTAGLAGGSWCGFGVEGEMPTDQREDDGRSLAFDSEPLERRLEILGAPLVELHFSVDRPLALVAARLNDVAPDGASTRVSYGVLNLTHRDGHEHPAPLEPERRYTARVELNDVAHAFAPGHRLRLALSTSYWPQVWPSPEPVTLRVFAGASSLELPVRPPRAADAELAPFPPPEAAPEPEGDDLDPAGVARTIERSLTGGETVYATRSDLTPSGRPSLSRVEAIDLESGHGIEETFRIRDGDPLSASGEVAQTAELRRGAWNVRVRTRTRLTADRERFRLEARLEAHEAENLVFSRAWDERVPRDLV